MNSRLKAYYTKERIAELAQFANDNRYAPPEHTIVGVDVDETICRHPFVAFLCSNGKIILREMF